MAVDEMTLAAFGLEVGHSLDFGVWVGTPVKARRRIRRDRRLSGHRMIDRRGHYRSEDGL